MHRLTYAEAVEQWTQDEHAYGDGDAPPRKATSAMPDCAGIAEPLWQVYENVSEGTPVSPAFATRPELWTYLLSLGAAQRPSLTGQPPPSRAYVDDLMERGTAATMMVVAVETRPGERGRVLPL